MSNPMKYAPLSSGFMLISILGFLVSVWLVMDWSQSWGFTFAVFFGIMFISAFVSMTKAEPIPEHMETLAIHEPKLLPKRKLHSPHFEKVHWYEPLLILYTALWLFFFYMTAVGKVGGINQILTVLFLLVTVVLMVFFIVDAVSNDRLTRWEQLIFTVILVFTAGLGIIIYYIYKRMHS
jgi:MFS family permease